MIEVTGPQGWIASKLIPKLPTRPGNYLIHLAACNDIRNIFNPRLIESNFILTHDLFTLMDWYRVIFASSTSAQELNNPYALSKKYGEYLCSKHQNALALRLFNVYGPGARRGIVKALIEAAYSGSEIEIQNGAQIRDFIYVDDVVALIGNMLDDPTGLIDIGTGIGTSINQIIQMISDITERKINIKRTKFDPTHQQAISVARSSPVFNYTQLEEGLRKTVESYERSCKV